MSKQSKHTSAEKEVSMEEYQRMVSSGATKTGDRPQYTKVLVVAALIILPIVGFICGASIQKEPRANTGQNQVQTAGGPSMMTSGPNGQMMSPGDGGRMIMRMGATGDVTAVSDTSITIKNDRSGEAETFTISSDTKIYNGRDAIVASSILVGDKVNIKAMSDDDSIASSIAVTTPVITEVEAVDNSTANSL